MEKIRATYYFRMAPQSWNVEVIKRIYDLGHEIGYHYEDVSEVAKGQKIRVKSQKESIERQIVTLAIESFENNLEKIRKIVPVKTICMHGSPLSRWDSKLLWKYYNYRDFDIIGEPYFDIDFNKILYLTDTGRRWDGVSFSIRDRVTSSSHFKFHSTQDIIKAVENKRFTDKVMMTFHPQRWSNEPVPWIKEFIFQNTKNVIKFLLRNRRDF